MNALGWFLLYAFVVAPLLAVWTGKALAGNSRRDFVPTAGPDVASAAAGETPSPASPAQGTATNP